MTFFRNLLYFGILYLMLAVMPQGARAAVAVAGPDCVGACGIPGLVEVQQGTDGRGGEAGNNPRTKPTGGLRRAARDEVQATDGSPEYVLLVNRGQATAAAQALISAGATLLRERPLPQFGQQMYFFVFPRTLTLEQGRALLAGRTPSAVLDLHKIYVRSAGPRVYHALMVGDAPGQSCRVGRSIRVGVIDGAVNAGHPAFGGVRIVRQSFLREGARRTGASHGTAVAGLIAGSSGAGPLAGLAPGVQVYAAEAFGLEKTSDGGRLEAVAAGLDWLVGSGVRLVNMSFAGASNQVFAKLLGLAQGRGVVIVAAAGNDRSGAPVYPAASPSTIAVTAVDAGGRLYGRANYGRHIEFAAPGVDLYVAWGNGGSYRSGTSFAAPVVTAILARQASRGGLSLNGARAFLRSSAKDLGPGGRDSHYGYGLVQSGGC
ncbi:S8 family serine peptidase [Roseovarius atlanticus]|uniref:S8 family serine peptidase n=1 Tax=Roseovarius atlanticus TaxID=1641875 RepID=UPI0007092C78|nr:S8 family serine peptidase [Roseovarius atlanticus]